MKIVTLFTGIGGLDLGCVVQTTSIAERTATRMPRCLFQFPQSWGPPADSLYSQRF